MTTRRNLFKAMAAGAIAVPLPMAAAVVTGTSPGAVPSCAPATVRRARGIEGQRKADLGDGTYLNPIVAATTRTRPSSRTATTTT